MTALNTTFETGDGAVRWGDRLHYDPSYNVDSGELGFIDFTHHPEGTVGAPDVRDCVTVVAYDGEKGAILHAYRGRSADELNANMRQLMSHYNPDNTAIAIIGGTDDVDANKPIDSSRSMLHLIDSALNSNGFSVFHRDICSGEGVSGRDIVLEANGTVHVDSHNKPYTINFHRAVRKNAISADIDFSADRTDVPRFNQEPYRRPRLLIDLDDTDSSPLVGDKKRGI